MSNLKHYLWSAFNKFGVEILTFIGNVLLARALSPEDFGLIAMLAIFSSIAMTLTDAGFNDCLIRKQNSDKYDFGTIATYNVFVSCVIYLLIYISAPLIASAFNRMELIPLARIMCISIILRSFTLSGFVQLSKELKFKQLAYINILTSLCSLIVTYIGALQGLGYWALGIQPIVLSVFNILFLVTIAKWRPYFCFYYSRFKDMFSYSSNLLLSYIVNTIGNNLYSFFIGKGYSTSDLGYYNQAHKMQMVPTQGINGIVLTTSYPIIAHEKDSAKRYQLYVNLFNQYVFILSFVVFALISVSYSVFALLFGEEWLPCVELFKFFMLISLFNPIITINANIIKIQGYSGVYRNLTFLRNTLQILSVLVTYKISIKAIIIGQIVATGISALCDMYICGRTIRFNFGTQIKMYVDKVLKPFLAYVISIILTYAISSPYCKDLVALSLYIVSFVIICIILKDQTFLSLLTKLKHLLKSNEK